MLYIAFHPLVLWYINR